MISKIFKPINILRIAGYIMFMAMALNTSAVSGLVFYISGNDKKPVYVVGKFDTSSVEREVSMKKKPVVAIQYKVKEKSQNLAKLVQTEKKHQEKSGALSKEVSEIKPFENVSIAKNLKTVVVKKIAEKVSKKNVKTLPSALDYIKAIKNKKWSYASVIDRYIVRYDKDTYIVLTLRPWLQKKLENIFRKYSSRLSAGIIQDPSTGAILAMTSARKGRTIPVLSKKYKDSNWALRATFPIASIFKIITASAGLETKKINVNSKIRAWRKSYLKVWQAFARSHNGVFETIGGMVGRTKILKYAKAFGFNKKFFFDLNVGKAVAKFPKNRTRFKQSCAGLNRFFMLSPMHVASIISTVVNGGKTMKPYLVDYVVRHGEIVFMRKPFQIARPIKKSTAANIYKMMHKTTTYGTAKRGFGGYRRCPNLAKMCGGKTGTLTGDSPKYLFTWFGGYMKVTGRDLTVVTLMGQKNHSQTKASSVAGQIAYELYMKKSYNDDDDEIVALK